MYLHAKNVNNFTLHNPESKANIPKTLTIFFLIPEILYGYNFGFAENLNSKLKILATTVRYFMRITVISVLLLISILAHPKFRWNIFYLVQYIGYLFVALSSKYKPYNFFQDIHRINRDLARKQCHVGIIALIHFNLVLAIGCLSNIYYCEYNKIECLSVGYICGIIPVYTFFIVIGLSVVVMEITQIIIFHYLSCCVKAIKNSAEIYVEPKIIQRKYVDVMDCFDKILPYHSKMLAVSVFCVTPKILSLGYLLLFYAKSQESWILVTVEMLFLIFTILHVMSPTVIAEMSNSQIEDIKLILLNKIINQTDNESVQTKEMRQLLWYMKERPLKRKVWGVMPLDLRLPVSLLGTWVTYIIVIIQMSNLYN